MSQSTSQQPVVPLADAPLAQADAVEDGQEEATVLLDAVPDAEPAAVPPVVEADPVTLAALYGGDQQAARLYAADVLRAILNTAPTPSSLTVHTKEWQDCPNVEVYLHRDSDRNLLGVYQGLYGGEVTREVFESGSARFTLTTLVFGVPVRVWTILPPDGDTTTADDAEQAEVES